MRELLPWLRLILQRKRRLVAGGGLILLTVLSAVGLLGLSGWFLTASAVTGMLLAQGINATLNIYTPGGGIRFFALTRTVARYVERVFNHDTVLRLLADLRVKLFATLARQLPHERTQARASDRLSRLVQDIDALDNLYLRLLAPLGVALVTSLVVSALALLFSMELALILLGLFLVLLVANTLGQARANVRRTAHRAEALESIRGRVIETLEGQAELSAAGLIGDHSARLMTDDLAMMEPQLATERSVAWAQGIITWSLQGAMLVALVFGLAAVGSGTVNGPVTVLIALALLGLGEVFINLPQAFADYGGTVASAHRLNSETRHEMPERMPIDDWPQPGALEWRGVSFGYADQAPVVKDFSMRLAPGDQVGIIGVSGSGKSTLGDLAGGLVTPDTGEILCHGQIWWPANGAGALRGVAYLTQRTHLFNGTLLDNLRMAREDVTAGEIWHTLEVVQMSQTVDQWPQGLLTWVGEAGRQLSGGEARRIALARTLLLKAPIVILDESFTGLDQDTAERLSAALATELSGKTVVALAHDENALPHVHRVIRLD